VSASSEVRERYERELRARHLHSDPAQLEAVAQLDDLRTRRSRPPRLCSARASPGG